MELSFQVLVDTFRAFKSLKIQISKTVFLN